MSGTKIKEDLETAFRTSIKYVSFILLPITVGIIVLSHPLVFILFGEAYSLAPPFLILMNIGNLFCGLGSLSMNSLLSSQGETKVILKINLLCMAVGIPMSLIFIPYFGVIGFLVSNLAIQALSTLLFIYWINKIFKFKTTWIGQSIRTYIAAFTMGILVWVALSLLRILGINSENILLGTGFFIGLLCYFLLLPLVGGIDSRDLDNIKTIFENFGFFASVFNILYIIMKRIIAAREHKSIKL